MDMHCAMCMPWKQSHSEQNANYTGNYTPVMNNKTIKCVIIKMPTSCHDIIVQTNLYSFQLEYTAVWICPKLSVGEEKIYFQ